MRSCDELAHLQLSSFYKTSSYWRGSFVRLYLAFILAFNPKFY